jgi:SAM-dependent methyltransferase
VGWVKDRGQRLRDGIPARGGAYSTFDEVQSMRPQTKALEPSRRDRFLVIAPGVSASAGDKNPYGWSPALRTEIEVSGDAADLVRQFEGGQSESEVVTTWSSRWAQASDSSQVAGRIRGAIDRLVEHGILVERLRMTPSHAATIIYGRPSLATQSYFVRRHGQYHSVRLGDLPCLKGLMANPADPASHPEYGDFLACQDHGLGQDSITAGHELAALFATISRLRDPHQWIRANPFLGCQRSDGALLLLRDAEALCIAMVLGLDVDLLVLPPEQYLGHLVETPSEFFGTSRCERPYQSIISKGQLLVRGIRTDLRERLDRIHPADLQGKRILDLGCNLGMSCYLAAERGAAELLGVDDRAAIAQAAVRLNTFFMAPCEFRVADLNNEVPLVGRADTVLVFAVLGHLASCNGVVSTIRKCEAKVVYFETHCDEQQQGDLEGFLDRGPWSSVTFLGHDSDNNFRGTRTRRMYRCIVR